MKEKIEILCKKVVNNNGFDLTQLIIVLAISLVITGIAITQAPRAFNMVNLSHMKDDLTVVTNETALDDCHYYLDIVRAGNITNVEGQLPPSSATLEVTSNKVTKGTNPIYITYGTNQITLTDTSNGTSYNGNFKYFLNGDRSLGLAGTSSSDNATSIVNSLSYNGATGICPIVPDGEAKVEKAIFEYMLNLIDLIEDNTEIVNFYKDSSGNITTYEEYEEVRLDYLKRLFGDVTEYSAETDKRVIALTQINLEQIENTNKFNILSSQSSDYICYVVSSIAPKSEAIAIMTDTSSTIGIPLTTDTSFAEKIYTYIKKNLQDGTVVVIPQKNSKVLYDDDDKAFMLVN